MALKKNDQDRTFKGEADNISVFSKNSHTINVAKIISDSFFLRNYAPLIFLKTSCEAFQQHVLIHRVIRSFGARFPFIGLLC